MNNTSLSVLINRPKWPKANGKYTSWVLRNEDIGADGIDSRDVVASSNSSNRWSR